MTPMWGTPPPTSRSNVCVRKYPSLAGQVAQFLDAPLVTLKSVAITQKQFGAVPAERDGPTMNDRNVGHPQHLRLVCATALHKIVSCHSFFISICSSTLRPGL